MAGTCLFERGQRSIPTKSERSGPNVDSEYWSRRETPSRGSIRAKKCDLDESPGVTASSLTRAIARSTHRVARWRSRFPDIAQANPRLLSRDVQLRFRARRHCATAGSMGVGRASSVISLGPDTYRIVVQYPIETAIPNSVLACILPNNSPGSTA